MRDIAVVMSVYLCDRLDFVEKSVQSILSQTYRDFDFYIAFDGPVSGDVDEYISSLKDPRIKHYRLEKNNGLAVALNYLLVLVLQRPEIKLIARMDADDISIPERFQKQRDFLISNPEISVVGCWYEEIDEEDKVLSLRRLPTDHESLRKRYYIRTPFAHPSVMYRRSLIEIAGFYPADTILMEDNALWAKALMNDLRFANIPVYLLKFRINKDFYIRRSGIKYGVNYIKTKLTINRQLDSPFYINLLSIGIGISRMLAPFLTKLFYRLLRK
jgi:glycosyltransferase involved in cell wall biosynthesis